MTNLFSATSGASSRETGSSPQSAATPNSVPSEYAGFQVISERNIFNTQRTSRSARADNAERQPRVERISLVGTLIYEKGPYAFFDGSSSAFRLGLERGKTIANFRITEITPTGVKLESPDKTLELGLGMELRREDEGAWEIAGSRNILAHSTSSSTSPAALLSENPADENEIAKRLMQQREQELK